MRQETMIYLQKIYSKFGDNDVTRQELVDFCQTTFGTNPKACCNQYNKGGGVFNFASAVSIRPAASVVQNQPAPVALNMGVEFDLANLTYQPDPTFVPFGCYRAIERIIKSGEFFPTYITGRAGGGKSTAVQEAAARNGLKTIKITITAETCDDDLFGSKTLVDGNIVNVDGPITLAAEHGFPVILEEISAGDPKKLFGLFTILEGRRHYIKALNKFVNPRRGFNIFVTDNTKGQGSADGKYIGTNILNEAFLDRFAATYEQDYPSAKIETQILLNNAIALGLQESNELTAFAEKLVKWADIIRISNREGTYDDTISTRRLIHIIKAFKIFNKQDDAVLACVTRFDETIAESFHEVWKMMDKTKVSPQPADTVADQEPTF